MSEKFSSSHARNLLLHENFHSHLPPTQSPIRRNMIISAENLEQMEKSLTTKEKGTADAPVDVSSPQSSDPQGSPGPGDPSVAGDLVVDDSSKNVEDGKNVSQNAAMILEAVSALNEPNGSNSGAILAYLKERQDLPPSFGKKLSSRLRKLVTQEKIEKVENGYKIKKGSSSTDGPVPKPEDGRPTQNLDLTSAGETVEEAAEIIKKGSSSTKAPSPKREEGRSTQNLASACHTEEEEAFSLARTIAEAEYRSLVAAIAVREWERVAKMAEDEDSLSQLADEIFEECISGEIQVLPKQSERTGDTTEESNE